MTTIVSTAGRFNIGYIPKRSKKRTDTSATALFPVTLPHGDTPQAVVKVSGPEIGEMIWAEVDGRLLHRHAMNEETFALADPANPLYFDAGSHRKTLTLNETALFSIREILLDGRTAAAAEAQRVANQTILAPDGLYAPTTGAYFRINLTINNNKKMHPTAAFEPIDGHRGASLSGCYPIPLLAASMEAASSMGWTVQCPFEAEIKASDAMIDAMLKPALESLCNELVGAGMPNRSAANFSEGHILSFLRYTDPDNPPTIEDLIEIVGMIEDDAANGDYTNPTGEKVLKSTLRNRLMNALLEHRGRRISPSI